MKKLKIKRGRPLLNYVLLTADKYTKEESVTSGGLYRTDLENTLKPQQTIIAVSPHVEKLGILKEGMLVSINIERYANSSQKQNTLKQDIDEHYDAVKTYQVPQVNIDGVNYLKLGDNDIDFIVEEWEYEDIEDSPIIKPEEPSIIIPKGTKIN